MGKGLAFDSRPVKDDEIKKAKETLDRYGIAAAYRKYYLRKGKKVLNLTNFRRDHF